jgi:hypothetical protein
MGIPHPHAAGALSVSDGGQTVGSVVEHDGSFFAFNVEGVLIGEYASQIEATRALPCAKRGKR